MTHNNKKNGATLTLRIECVFEYCAEQGPKKGEKLMYYEGVYLGETAWTLERKNSS